MKRIIFVAALALASPAWAQSVPPPFTVWGAQPTLEQWKAAWASKQDVGGIDARIDQLEADIRDLRDQIVRLKSHAIGTAQ